MKILVTTDHSSSSKAAIRFAAQLSRQRPCSLVFIYVIKLLVPTKWSRTQATTYMEGLLRDEEERLEKFVRQVLKELKIRPRQLEFVVRQGNDVAKTVIDYARECKASFICISTRGAGKIRRILGTNTSGIVTHSHIPVFAIPKNYKQTRLEHVLYASDLDDINQELKKVNSFAAMVKAKVSVLHFDYFLDLKEARGRFEKVASRFKSPKTSFYLQKFDWEESLSTHIRNAIRKLKPSIVCLFTKQERNWYQRIFLSSKSADLTYDTKKPLLVFPKHG